MTAQQNVEICCTLIYVYIRDKNRRKCGCMVMDLHVRHRSRFIAEKSLLNLLTSLYLLSTETSQKCAIIMKVCLRSGKEKQISFYRDCNKILYW